MSFSNDTYKGGGGTSKEDIEGAYRAMQSNHQKVQELERRLSRTELEMQQRIMELDKRMQELSSFMHYSVAYHPGIVAEWNNVTKATKRVLGEKSEGWFKP